MLKETRKEERCDKCNRVEFSTLYDVYCDECGELFESGTSYGSVGERYIVWNDSITDFDKSHYDKSFCCMRCLVKSLKKEDLTNGKRVSIDFHINEQNREDIINAFKE